MSDLFDNFLISSEVYFIRNRGTGDFYIGSSYNADHRFKEHLRLLKKKKHPNYKLQKSYNECQDIFLQYYPCTLYEGSIKEHREYAFETEFSLITSYSNDPKLLNINLDGCPMGMFGKKHSDGAKKKQSDAARKRWEKPGEKEKRAELSKQMHKAFTPSQKQRNSKRMTLLNNEYKKDPIIKQKQINGTKGYWNKPGNREKQSKARKEYFLNGGYKYQLENEFTDYHKQQISIGRKKYWLSLTQAEKNIQNKKRAVGQRKKVIVGDKIYNSREEAAIGENISSPTVKDRINSKSEKFKDWKWG